MQSWTVFSMARHSRLVGGALAFAACATLMTRGGCGSGSGSRAISSVGGGTALPQPTGYTVTVLPGEDLTGFDINNAGQVAGRAGRLTGDSARATLFQNGAVQTVSSYPYSFLHGLNETGQAVGTGSDGQNNFQAFVYENNTVRRLPLVFAPNAQGSDMAYDINNRGQIVGESNGHALLWEKGTMIDLHRYATGALPSATESEAVSINDKGQILVSVQETGSNTPNRLLILTPIMQG